MELSYKVQEESAKIFYGETLVSQLKDLRIQQPVLFLANQRYYDLYAEKLNQLFPNKSDIDWYVCGNTHCNHLSELSSLLSFAKRYPENQPLLIIGFGNEGVMELAGFFQKHTYLPSKLWLIPVSIRSMARALTAKRVLLNLPNQVILQTNNLPERIIYDQTISDKQIEGKQIDFLIFICCGLICDYPFLQNLYVNYPNQSNLFSRPFAGMVEEMIYFYEDQADNLSNYGKLFEQAFYRTENGHLLSSSMKKFLGMVMQLVWNSEIAPLSFQLKNFFIWLQYLGYPIDWPKEIPKMGYLENVLYLAEKSKKILVLKKIGIIGGYQLPDEKELLKTMASFERIVHEIRGV
ncbi:hypothetical protein A5844_000365 [Enterococcus sp. 10A9_DIV0425]|uniref:Alcohol dehydrogenase iron-type/glycerol dehydrogenase GldA domain-containing protein n=1 Tax=Candidatus Enterococcus wittei TaxID=1987383 RepID=A0A2C9XPR1_9ENTE|nr:hypothetical protein [Enterococcus sp. 10A9_DIV0425]OTP12149.1 hypothetical protein A5844_000365 [Enterococcus sp. 10A9_DIV0425]THE16124.1 hypothetical protein E1H99_00785 [Enterococcus hirae]